MWSPSKWENFSIPFSFNKIILERMHGKKHSDREIILLKHRTMIVYITPSFSLKKGFVKTNNVLSMTGVVTLSQYSVTSIQHFYSVKTPPHLLFIYL